MLLTSLLSACARGGAEPLLNAKVQLNFDPSPPAVGATKLDVRLTDPSGQPVRLGQLSVEGNMNHAGMKPVFTDLKETQPGQYSGAIEFTMGGDWFLLLSAELPDGGEWSAKVDVPAVKAK